MQTESNSQTQSVATERGLAVVHLVVREYGLDPFEAFLESYRTRPAGCPHDLIIAAKQFESETDFDPWSERIGDIPYQLFRIPDRGLDIGSYFEIAFRTNFARYFFCNSRTVILVDDWLAHLCKALDENPNGVVGATGSWQSISSEHFRNLMKTTRWPAPLKRFRALIGMLRLWVDFPTFPNPHLRTNAFLIERKTMFSLTIPEIGGKWDAMRFESGRHGMTRQISANGGDVRVVNLAGESYLPKRWRDTKTFWQNEQSGLLIGDNQTDKFARSQAHERRCLSRIAWEQPR